LLLPSAPESAPPLEDDELDELDELDPDAPLDDDDELDPPPGFVGLVELVCEPDPPSELLLHARAIDATDAITSTKLFMTTPRSPITAKPGDDRLHRLSRRRQ
jgi:hypothetical protein